MTFETSAPNGTDSYLGDPLRGLTVRHLAQNVIDEMDKLDFERYSTVASIEEPLIRARGANLHCPVDGRIGAAYVDTVNHPCGARSTHMLSYTWQYRFGDIVDTLTQFCEERDLDVSKVVIWMCCFCVNQHRVIEKYKNGQTVPFEEFKRVFSERVTGIGRIIAMMEPWKDPQYVRRVWCNFELFTAVEKDCELTIMMPPQEAEDLRCSLTGSTGLEEIWRTLMKIDVEQAQASMEDDRRNILKLIQEGVGFEKFNNVVTDRLRSWIVQSTETYMWLHIEKGTLLADKGVALCAEVGGLLTQVSLYDRAQGALDEGMKFAIQSGLASQVQHLREAGLGATRRTVDGSLLMAKLLRNTGANLSKGFNNYEDALARYNEAKRIYQDCGLFETSEYAELLRNIGLVHKFSGDLRGCLKVFQEARKIRESTKTLNTPEGADLLKNIGAALFDNGLLDAALVAYTEALRIIEMTGTLETPSAAGLLMNIGIVKAHCGDLDDALDIYRQALRIRSRTGTENSLQGKWLKKCIENVGQEKQVLELFKQAKNEISLANLQDLLHMVGMEGPQLDVVLNAFTPMDSVSSRRFVHWLFTGNGDLTGMKSSEVRRASHVVMPEVKSQGVFEPELLVWNIQSPQFSNNPLELVPGDGFLGPESQKTYERLEDVARRLIINPDKSPMMGDFLGDLPLEVATQLETSPITDEPRGLRQWLESRSLQWADLWPGLDAAAAASQWCADFRSRWAFWRRQSLHAWLCDDGSGGKTNPLLLPAQRPAMDDVCWQLCLGQADAAYGSHPSRCKRASWLSSGFNIARMNSNSNQNHKFSPTPGRHDFFKLLIWDLVVAKILREVTEHQLDALLRDLRHESKEDRLRKVVQRIHSADIAILLEVPAEPIAGLEAFWQVAADVPDPALNTVILARKSKFDQPDRVEFRDHENKVSTRVIGCKLTSSDGSWRAHITGVHLSGKGYESEVMFPQLEKSVHADSVVAGDFNVDLRHNTDFSSMPNLSEILDGASNLPSDRGTTNKQRSCFQAQVSKMLTLEFSMKDFIFVGSEFLEPKIHGLILRSRRIPDGQCPSDHAFLSTTLRMNRLLRSKSEDIHVRPPVCHDRTIETSKKILDKRIAAVDGVY